MKKVSKKLARDRQSQWHEENYGMNIAKEYSNNLVHLPKISINLDLTCNIQEIKFPLETSPTSAPSRIW